MAHFIRYTLVLIVAAAAIGCGAHTREAVSPPDGSRNLMCRNVKQQVQLTNARDCIERGGMLL